MTVELPFSDRAEAGRLLGEELRRREWSKNCLILALPRGGVPVAAEVAAALDAPLDVVVVRKVGVPWQPELAMGAIADDAAPVLDEELIRELRISPRDVDALVTKQREEIKRREKLYRGERPALLIAGQCVIVVDDGLATGSTMVSALRYLRGLTPAKLIAAVPVASRQACQWIRGESDEAICLATPEPFLAVGEWYRDFRQVSDAEVRRLLEKTSPHRQAG